MKGRNSLAKSSIIVTMILMMYITCTIGVDAGPDDVSESKEEMLVRVLANELPRRMDELGRISESDTYMVRTYMTPAWFQAAELITEWMKDAGLIVRMDEIGNIRGRTPRDASYDGPALVLGSHMDTVIDGGKYDGALGAITPISAVKALLLSRKGKLLRPIEVIAVADEDSIRFYSTYFASKALTGELTQKDLDTYIDKDGNSLSQVLYQNGMDGSIEAVAKATIDPSEIYAFVELHIEQGPALDLMKLPVAVVTKIIGSAPRGEQSNFKIYGKQGHAGTSTMSIRKDALAAAAEAIIEIEKLCSQHPQVDEEMLVCTVGKVIALPGVSNVISGNVEFTLDLRCASDAIRMKVAQDILRTVTRICLARGLECEVPFELYQDPTKGTPTREMDESLSQKLLAASEKASLVSEKLLGSYCGSASEDCNMSVPLLPSGAGHDAYVMANIAPSAMLWIRCKDGVSHAPQEFVSDRDIAEGAMAMFTFLEMESYDSCTEE